MNLKPIKQREKHLFNEIEDNKIRQLVKVYGDHAWRIIASEIPNRSPRQCRERWKNYLSPNVVKRPWTDDEDNLLLSLRDEIGKHWSKIAKYFDSRTDINVKNRYMLLQRKENKKINKNRKMKKYDQRNQIPLKSDVKNNKKDEEDDKTTDSNFLNERSPLIDFWDMSSWGLEDGELIYQRNRY